MGSSNSCNPGESVTTLHHLHDLQVVASLQVSLADCQWEEKGLTVGEGEVVGFMPEKSKVQICKKGKLVFRKEKRVSPYTLACNGESSCTASVGDHCIFPVATVSPFLAGCRKGDTVLCNGELTGFQGVDLSL